MVWLQSRTGRLGAGAVLLAFLGLIEPAARALLGLGVLVAAANVLLAHWRRPRTLAQWPTLALALAVAWGMLIWFGPNFHRGDSWDYYWYLPSALNGTLARQASNVHGVGPACLWAPAFAVAHLYVRLCAVLGLGGYAADGWSAPYLFAAAGTTVAVAVIGAAVLVRQLACEYRWPTATIAVLGVTLASPLPVYLFHQPLMSHGLVFGLACVLVAIWLRAWQAPESSSVRTWLALGALIGALALLRGQAVVSAVPVAALGLRDVLTRKAPLRWLALGCIATALAILPQLLVWRVLRGVWLTMPQGQGFMDWSSPHLFEVLLSADHGLFTWTPVALLAAAGWALRPRWCVAWLSAAVLFATAWVNGGVRDWWASDAYGARRFDVAWPFLAIGMAILITWMAGLVRRYPLSVPAALLAALVLWNVGMTRFYLDGRFVNAAPLDEVAANQVLHVRRLADGLAGALAGPSGRNLVYGFFVGHYLGVHGIQMTFDLGDPHVLALVGGWSEPGRGLRWTVPPTSCVRVPFEEARDARVTLNMRARQQQLVRMQVNGKDVGRDLVEAEWRTVDFVVPSTVLAPGLNYICLEAASPVAVKTISLTLLRMGRKGPRRAPAGDATVAR